MTKVLVVEDDRKIAAAIKRGLGAEGFTVEVSHDGDDGFWHASELSYDVIVLDIMLPGRSGFRVCHDLRAVNVWTPILVLTARDGDLDETRCLDIGADDYLVKPFSFPVLVARIHALLRRTRRSAGPPLRIGPLLFDPIARILRHDDKEIELTAREFDVFAFLVRRAGHVVSKSEIVEGVWADDFDGDFNIVEVYIGRLRRKLDDAIGRRAIATIRGVGYRLDAN